MLFDAVCERARVLFLVLLFAGDARLFAVRLVRDAAFGPVLDLLRALVLRFAPAARVDLARDEVDLPPDDADLRRVPPVFARLLLALVLREPAAFARPPAFALRRVPLRDVPALRVTVRRRAGCARVPGSDMLIPASANSASRSPMSVMSDDWRFADPDFRAIGFLPEIHAPMQSNTAGVTAVPIGRDFPIRDFAISSNCKILAICIWRVFCAAAVAVSGR